MLLRPPSERISVPTIKEDSSDARNTAAFPVSEGSLCRMISNKMLSKYLKELEVNKLVKRTVLDTQPVTVQYELTAHGKTLKTIINNLTDWGLEHRKEITGRVEVILEED